MKDQRFAAVLLLPVMVLSAWLSFAEAAGKSNSSTSGSASAATSVEQTELMRLEGERRFHANCGRCHMPPHKFPPRVFATAVRHMRVRANITDDDMRLILFFLTQ